MMMLDVNGPVHWSTRWALALLHGGILLAMIEELRGRRPRSTKRASRINVQRPALD